MAPDKSDSYSGMTLQKIRSATSANDHDRRSPGARRTTASPRRSTSRCTLARTPRATTSTVRKASSRVSATCLLGPDGPALSKRTRGAATHRSDSTWTRPGARCSCPTATRRTRPPACPGIEQSGGAVGCRRGYRRCWLRTMGSHANAVGGKCLHQPNAGSRRGPRDHVVANRRGRGPYIACANGRHRCH